MKQLKRSFKLMFALFLSIFMLNSGCKKSTVNQSELVAPNLANSKSSAMFLAETDIGKKLPNPYTVANMQRALANLATKGDVKKVANLIPTSH